MCVCVIECTSEMSLSLSFLHACNLNAGTEEKVHKLTLCHCVQESRCDRQMSGPKTGKKPQYVADLSSGFVVESMITRVNQQKQLAY